MKHQNVHVAIVHIGRGNFLGFDTMQLLTRCGVMCAGNIKNLSRTEPMHQMGSLEGLTSGKKLMLGITSLQLAIKHVWKAKPQKRSHIQDLVQYTSVK